MTLAWLRQLFRKKTKHSGRAVRPVRSARSAQSADPAGQADLTATGSILARLLPLPLGIIAVAGFLMITGDLLARQSCVLASIFLETGMAIYTRSPVFIAAGLALGLTQQQRRYAVLAAALAGLVWLESGRQTVIWLAPAGRTAIFDLGLLPGLAAGLMTSSVFRLAAREQGPRWLSCCRKPSVIMLCQVPIAILGGFISGLLWSAADRGLTALAGWITGAGQAGLFVYGVLNRLLLPVGLHHILDREIWQFYGQYTTQSGLFVQGDLLRFIAGDPTAGRFTAGFYPVFMFILPAVLLSSWLAARKLGRRLPAPIFLAAGLLSLLGGLTDVADWLILLMSPVLYVLYALLGGLSLILVNELQILHGFSFSAGLFDYLYLWQQATRPVWILPAGAALGLISFWIQYILVRWRRWTGASTQLPATIRTDEILTAVDEPLSASTADPQPTDDLTVAPETVREPESMADTITVPVGPEATMEPMPEQSALPDQNVKPVRKARRQKKTEDKQP